MKRAKAAFRHYLARVGRLEAIRLGDAGEKTATGAPTEQDNQLLLQQIRSATSSTNLMVGVLMAMLVIVFGTGVFLVLRAEGSVGAVATISGGTLLTLLVIIERLRRLWIEKAMLDIAWAGVREWSPENVLALVELLYWHSIGSWRKRPTAAVPTQDATP